MPKFTLPPIKNEEKHDQGVPSTDGMDVWRRRISIPINMDILRELKVGEEAKIMLTGKVIVLASRENMDMPRESNMEIEVAVVEAYGSENAEDAFEKGYKEVRHE